MVAPAGTTSWFLPSIQQWVKMQTGLGGLSERDITWCNDFDPSHTAAETPIGSGDGGFCGTETIGGLTTYCVCNTRVQSHSIKPPSLCINGETLSRSTFLQQIWKRMLLWKGIPINWNLVNKKIRLCYLKDEPFWVKVLTWILTTLINAMREVK